MTVRVVGQRLQPGHVRGEGEAAVADRQGGVGIDTLHDRMVPRDQRATVDGGIGGGEGAGGQAGEGRREPNAHAISLEERDAASQLSQPRR